ncbi:MAG TPA: hypothetical protein VK843_02650 [Planctomycetota bacterium]|nr:hypothetical protein [Planctomycetota bacterium]
MKARAIHTTVRGRRSGMTLVEVVITACVLAMLLGAVGNTVLHGNNAYKQGLSNAVLEGQTRRLLDRISSEFSDVDRSSLNPNPLAPFWASTVDYARCQGWAGGAMLVGPTRRIQLALEAGEIDNGIDDNGNGLIDERCVVLVPDTAAPGKTIMLGSYVRECAEGETQNGVDEDGNGLTDEPGLFFRHDGNGTLHISLTLERPDAWGRLVTRTLRTAVRMRND